MISSASRRGDVELVQHILHSTPLLSRDTLVVIAAGSGHVEVLKELNLAGCSVNVTVNGVMPLNYACRMQDLEMTRTILAYGAAADPQHVGQGLAGAIVAGWREMVEHLLKLDYAFSRKSENPVSAAVRLCNLEILKLVSHTFKLSRSFQLTKSLALAAEQDDADVIRFVWENYRVCQTKAIDMAFSHRNLTAFNALSCHLDGTILLDTSQKRRIASGGVSFILSSDIVHNKETMNDLFAIVCSKRNISEMRMYLEHGANPHCWNSERHALTTAEAICMRGHLEGLKLLVEYGLDLTQKNLLYFSILSDNEHLVDFLLKAGVQDTKKFGIPGLHRACGRVYNPQMLNLLLQYFDIDSRDTYGMTPILYAVRARKVETVRFLLKNKADIRPMKIYAPRYLVKVSTWMLIEPFRSYWNNMKYIWLNCLNMTVSVDAKPEQFVLKELLESKIEAFVDDKGRNVFHLAAMCNNANAAKLLLLHEFPVIEDNDGNTPLHTAAAGGQSL